MSHPPHFRKITTILLLVLLFSVPALFADGIASRYPNDVGIGNDPLVLLFDGFENYVQASDVRIENGGVWDTGGGNYTRISTEQHFSGNKSYEMDFPIINVETQMGLERFISPVEPVLFVRAYFRYDPNFYLAPGSSHKGISMRGRYPGPCGGTPGDGTGWFLFLLQNNIEGSFQSGEQEPGFGHVYAYWPHQRGDCGDHWYPTGHLGPSLLADWLLYPYLYPDFVARPNFNVPRGQWFCYEFMVKTNDIGQNNGEIKVWKDGIMVADFPDLFIRSIPDLMIDAVRLVFHAHHSEQVNKLWWDNIVIARSYIGPIATPTPTPTPGAATAVVADFDSDGHTDWVVHLVGTTLTAIVYMDDNVAIGANFGPTLPAGWSLRGAADFDGDTHPDYGLFKSVTGQTAIWYLNDNVFLSGAATLTSPSGWALVATADFNGDGKPDYLVYRASSGQTALVHMNNNVAIDAVFGPTLPVGWNVVGVADFDGDSHPDYALFNSTTGQTAIWYLNDNVFLSGAATLTLPSGWALVATADFNGDGKPDYLVYRASSGQTALVHMNNNVAIDAVFGPTLPVGWSLVAQ